MSNKYAGITALQTFLDNLKNLFATKTEVNELSLGVAYIDENDNETVTLATEDDIQDINTLIGGDV